MPDKIRIGGASGFWGEADLSVPQLLAGGQLDYIVFDYLAETTMAILARARTRNPDAGYATDFVSSVLERNLPVIADQGVKVIANAGGVNPRACAEAIKRQINALELNLSVAVVEGDDIMPAITAGRFSDCREMYSGASLPPTKKLLSANAYLGAFPIAHALKAGADIVVTGRCVDSAVTLGACIHAFGWGTTDLDQLAAGSLAGHVLECGPQATGGNFTDWEDVGNIAHIGYPIAEVSDTGEFICEKPSDTGGLVSIGTVGEQILYEIEDPQSYILPDVVCDFSQVTLEQVGIDKVRVSGAKGREPTLCYKVSVIWHDGFRGTLSLGFTGFDPDQKFRTFGDAALARAREKLNKFNLPDFEDVCIEAIGTEAKFGSAARDIDPREIVGSITVKHAEPRGVEVFMVEGIGVGLATPPGLSSFSGGKPRPMPLLRLFSCLVPKSEVPICVLTEVGPQDVHVVNGQQLETSVTRPAIPRPSAAGRVDVPLIRLAFGRSGDKGDNANIGIMARRPEYLPYIADTLTAEVVEERFSHRLKGRVERFYLPGLNALNYVLHGALGGGGTASLHDDPLGKAYAQILLGHPIKVPTDLAKGL